MKNSRWLKIILISLVLLAFASAAYAFAASNTIPGTKAGDGRVPSPGIPSPPSVTPYLQ